MINTVLFDLDGTLTDSEEGIINCIIYALEALGIKEENRNKLKAFIGPPLKEAFRINYNLTEENAQLALLKYRERYNDVGIFENKVYDGIDDVLKMLYEKNINICLATGKPQPYAERILEHFGLLKYFTLVCGSGFDGTMLEKSDVINYIINTLPAPCYAIMAGDRKFDVEAAHKCGIKCIGTEYGFPEENELINAGADYIAKNVYDLKKILTEII